MKSPKKKQNLLLKLLTADLQSGKKKMEMFENIGSMLSANLNIEKVIDDLIVEATDKTEKTFLGEMQLNLNNGIPFWEIMSEGDFLTHQSIALLRIGEESGTLGKNVELVMEQVRKDKEFKAKLKSASLYPIIVMVLMIIVSIGIAMFILPAMGDVYSSFNTDLPLPTRIMIATGDFMGKYGIIVGPLIMAVLGAIGYYTFKYEKTKHVGQAILFKIPGVKGMIVELELGRLGYILNNLLESGMSVPKAFILSAESSDFRVYKKIYITIAEEIEGGLTFTDAFSKVKNLEKYIPTFPRQLLVNGFNTGRLSENSLKIGKTYEKKGEVTLKNIEVIFEPMLLLIVWVGVAFIALAVIMPIYSLIGGITDLG